MKKSFIEKIYKYLPDFLLKLLNVKTTKLLWKTVIIEEINKEKNRVKLKTKDWKNLWWFLLDKDGNFIIKKLWDKTVYVENFDKETNSIYFKTLEKELWEKYKKFLWIWLWWFQLDENWNLMTKKLWDEIVYVEFFLKEKNQVFLKTKDWKILWMFQLNEDGNIMTINLWNKTVYVEEIDKEKNRIKLKTEEWKDLWWFNLDEI